MPRAWTYENKNDLVNMKNIHRLFGTVELKKFPLLGCVGKFRIHKSDFSFVCLLNYINFKKTEALKTLMKEWGFRVYGHKHYENIFSRFYQGYMLPTKWGIDKRKSHLSSLVRNGEITRKKALVELEKSPYDATDVYGVDVPAYNLEGDRKLVLTKLKLSEDEFEALMRLPNVQHEFYGTDKGFYDLLDAYNGCRRFVGRQLKRVKRHLP